MQEQAQLAESVDRVLQWRRERNVEWESVVSELEGKRSALAGLERTEAEATRVQQGLQRGSTGFGTATEAPAEGGFPPAAFPPGPASTTEETASDGSSFPPAAVTPNRGGSILSTLNSLIDNDPAATRRASIARTREKILALSERREQLQAELASSGTGIQSDLDRYQREKMAELKGIMVAFAKEMRDWSRKSAQAWEEAEREVEKADV
jgi:sorting nexin-4